MAVSINDTALFDVPAAPIVMATAVMEIDTMPRTCRPLVEEAMVECVPSPSEVSIPGQDPLDAHWFTRWLREPFSRFLRCREVITGLPTELDELAARLDELAAEHGFSARLRRAD